MIKLIILSTIILTLAFSGMAIRLIMSNNKKNKELTGSCGGSGKNSDCCLNNNKCKKN